MGVKIKHIIEGWTKRLGIVKISEDNESLAEERLSICINCEDRVISKMLVFLRDSANEELVSKCKNCGCPIHEKIIVTDEICPLKKW